MGPVTPSQPQVRRSQFQGNTRQSRVNLSLSRVEPSQHQSVHACVRLFSRSPRTQPNQMISLYIYVINADTFLDGPTYWIACWIAYKFCLGLRKANYNTTQVRTHQSKLMRGKLLERKASMNNNKEYVNKCTASNSASLVLANALLRIHGISRVAPIEIHARTKTFFLFTFSLA